MAKVPGPPLSLVRKHLPLSSRIRASATLQWLRSQDPPCPWCDWTFQAAAERGCLEILQWLQSQRCPMSESTCRAAARAGHLQALQWLRAQNPPCPWSEQSCEAAARCGYLHILKWLRCQDPPCPWSEKVCQEAAERGHLTALQWLRGQDPPCPWDAAVCAVAASERRYDVLGWALLHGCPIPSHEDHWRFQRLRTRLLFLTCVECTSRRQVLKSHTLANSLLTVPSEVIHHIAQLM